MNEPMPQPPAFPRWCKTTYFPGEGWCHGFFSGSQPAAGVYMNAVMAVIERGNGQIVLLPADQVSFAP